jgi:carboxypeptidase family protein
MRKLVFGSFFSLLILATLHGQEFSGLAGVVLDKSGAAIADVEVALDNDQVNIHLQTTTNDVGNYQFPRVPPGPGYKLTFSKTGFKKLEISDVSLGVALTTTRNATLEIGEVTQFIEVKASAAETLNTKDASIGNVLGTQALENLPSIFRENPSTLLGLQAGVTPNAGGGANRAGAVTGARTDQSNITIDGIDVNDQAGGFAYTTVGNAPIESIEEFRVTTANGIATDGRSAGGQIQLVTKGGTNEFHGSAYELNRTAATAANDFFNNSAGVKRPALTRNQFGGAVGGPVLKNKLFFFFNYEGRRDASQSAQSRTVPLDHVRTGGLAYVHTGNDVQGNPCNRFARLNDPVTAQCITTLTNTQVASFDPQSIGADPALMTVITGRYPKANDLTGGDGINTGFFRFNAPNRVDHNTYVTRIDYKLNSKQSLFGKFNIVRESDTQVVQQFPGDPAAQLFQDRTYTYVIGHTWTINANNINTATFGVTRQLVNIPAGPKAFPTFPNEFTYGPYSGAFFSNFNIQSRTVPVPTIRDDYAMVHGKHTFEFGMNLRPIRQKSSLTNDFNFIGIGIGGNLSGLGPNGSSLRPSDFVNSQTERNEWDSTFTFLLGRFANQQTNFNYNVSLQPQPPGTGKRRDFHYNEFEFYGQDSWKMRNDLTLTYGLRWSYYGVPFEANGFETVPNVGLDQLFSTRVQNGANGVSGPSAAPLLTYDLGGPANNAKGYYSPRWTNFGPRLGLAWNPSFKSGLFNSVLGDRKTTIRVGGSVVYDRVAGTVSFVADQLSFLFQNSASQLFGQTDPVAALQTDPRFTSLTAPPVAVVPPVVTRPITPFVDSTGFPFGVQEDQFIYAVDPKFKTPYEDVFGLSVQRQLPADTLLEIDYVGRLGRRLFAQSDGAQIVDFKDPGCPGCPFPGGQGLIAAFNNIATAVRANEDPNTIPTQPFFENQFLAATGATCQQAFGTTCTSLYPQTSLAGFFSNGDISDFIVALNAFGIMNPNVGLPGQAASIAYVSSKSSSSYNGLLVVLRKRMSHGLQMDFDYAFSHSIDNTSSVVNVVDTGFVCDLRNLRVCRGNSDFDATHIVSSNWVYDLPFGHKGYIGRNSPGWADRIIGDWSVSGIWSWHTGFAVSTATSSYPVGNFFGDVNGVPAVFNGNTSALASKIHDEAGNLQYFASPTNALSAFSFPLGGEIGNRNNLRGPGYWTVDLRVKKDIKMPWSERQKLRFFAEAFNAFNHENFVDPNTNISSGSFGALTATRSAFRGEGARQMQFALRYAF